MKYKIIGLVLLFVFITSLLFPTQEVKEKDLPQQYRDWLTLTKYIIHEKEKDVFMMLTNNRDRDIFIENFWTVRDPTPGTSLNEFKEEHTKRFLYVKKRFKRGSSREGWMTDMGMIHIILGPPVSIERFPATKGIYPSQIWSYYGDVEKGMPTHFTLVFFQRSGVGEYRLYNPVSDGITSLLVESRTMDPFDYELLYEKISELAPTLALSSLSIIPGEIPFNYQPSPREAIIMADIIESPKKGITTSYATHFLDYKGIVSTEYLTNYVECEANVALIRDPLMDRNFMHFSMVPKSISIDYYEPNDQYFCNFSLDVSLRIKDNMIFQYTKKFPFYFAPEDLNRIRANGISIEDSFPVIEGDYKLIILLQNSVGKEFSIFEKDISIPKDSGLPQIVGPFLGYDFQAYQRNMHMPYKVLGEKLVVDPANTFAVSDNISFFFNIPNLSQGLWEGGQVRVLIEGLKPNNPSQKSFTLRLNNHPFRRTLTVTHSFEAVDLSPDYYNMTFNLIDEEGNSIDNKTANFVISPEEVIPHPLTHAKTFSHANDFLFYYVLAQQYENVQDYKNAEANYEKAYELKPDYNMGLFNHANFLLKIKNFDRGLEIVENLREDDNMKFEYFLIKGKAYMGKELYSDAIDNFLEGNKIYNSDIGLLNALGLSFYKTGDVERALDALKASLRLNPEQEDIKKLVEEIEKNGN